MLITDKAGSRGINHGYCLSINSIPLIPSGSVGVSVGGRVAGVVISNFVYLSFIVDPDLGLLLNHVILSFIVLTIVSSTFITIVGSTVNFGPLGILFFLRHSLVCLLLHSNSLRI